MHATGVQGLGLALTQSPGLRRSAANAIARSVARSRQPPAPALLCLSRTLRHTHIHTTTHRQAHHTTPRLILRRKATQAQAWGGKMSTDRCVQG